MENRIDDLLVELERCEIAVWEALVSGDKRADAAALHDAFLGVYSDGFAEKAHHIQQLDDGPTIARYALTQCRVLPLGDDHAVFAYRADFLRTGKATAEAMYISSIWRRRPDGWVNVFSQDTPALE